MKAPHAELLTPAEAGQMFGVAHRTLRQWAADGRITRHHTPAGTSRYLRAELEQIRAERETVAVA
jgi:predicted site-specific integrase-resolvase